MRLVIASRKSDLARIQAYFVGQNLQKKNPQLQIEYHFRESLGDVNLNDPLWKMPEKGVFTEDFYKGLMDGDYDMVVHSWKDLPIDSRTGTVVAATLPREDVRDVLLFKKQDLKKEQITIFTSSPRRVHNLAQHLPQLLPKGFQKIAFQPVRGNVQTRVRKMMEGEASGLVVAKAALDRLLAPDLAEEFVPTRRYLQECLQDLQWMILPITLNPPAAAQGALAIEIREDREDLKKILHSVQCKETFAAVVAERELLKSWGGGCHQKIGVSVLQRPYGRLLCAKGQRDSGEVIDVWHLERKESFSAKQGYFPEHVQEALWFDRERITPSEDYKKANAHWISKAEALPENLFLDHTQLIWTSGVRTWISLARRGLWVYGSSESLGEREDMRLAPLDQTSRNWCKWTHADGEGSETMPLIKSYRLKPKTQQPQLSEATEHYFWMSGSSFREALKKFPWLVHKTHWSGPGHTAEALRSEIQKRQGHGSAHIAFSFEEWQKLMRQKKD
jgi:hydroxymethylbilane synthase